MTKYVRGFSAMLLIILSVLISFSYSCLGQTDEKPVYKFEDVRISQADTLLAHKQYAEALKAYQQTLDTYSKESFYEGMVYATERMAFCHRRLRDDKRSAETFQKAINLAKEKLEPNHMLLSKAYLNNGLRAYYTKRTNVARIQIDSAYSTYSKSNGQLPSILRQLTKFKYYTYLFTNQSQDSIFKYLNLRKELFTSNGATHEENLYLIADYARAYINSGDFEKAKIYALEEVRLSDPSKTTGSSKSHSRALFTLGKTLVTNDEFEQGLSVANRLINFTIQNNPESKGLSGFLGLKAIALTGLRRHSESEGVFLALLEVLKEREDTASLFYTTTLMNLGVSNEFQSDFDEAEKYLELALEGSKKLKAQNADNNLEERYSYFGQFFNSTNQHELSLQYYDSAINTRLRFSKQSVLSFPDLSGINFSDWLVKRLIYKSEALMKLYSYTYRDSTQLLYSSLEHVEKTHEYILEGRKNPQNASSKIQQANKFKDLYEVGLEAYYNLFKKRLGRDLIIRSFQNMTQSKSLLFLNQMGEYSILYNETLPAAIGSEFALARMAIDSLDNQINQQISIDPLGDSVMVLNTEKMKWNARLAEVRETIEGEYPDAGSDLLSKDVTINSLRTDHQLTNQRALIEYFVGDSVIFVVGLSGEKESFHRIQKDKKLNNALSSFLGEVNTSPHSGEFNRHLKNFAESASTLYQELLQPVLDDLGEISEMIIVPDDILSRVPFEMLISEWSGEEKSFKELNYLLKTVKVSHMLSSKVSFNELAQNEGKGMLGFGYVGEGIVDERAEMGGLPGALKEINFLKSNFAGDYYMGKEGTKRQFLKKAGDYDVIHLALHGKSDSVNRYNSALVFNGDKDYYMTSTDLYRTRLKSKLAVLSACETGIGKISEGEGSFSIARGFAIAGVPAIVTTLWKVNDEAGASITRQFYRNLQTGNQKDEALRQAKLKYLEESDNLTSSPFYWGSYILIGDTSTIELKEKAGLPFYWILAAFVVLSALGLGLRRLSRKPFNQAA